MKYKRKMIIGNVLAVVALLVFLFMSCALGITREVSETVKTGTGGYDSYTTGTVVDISYENNASIVNIKYKVNNKLYYIKSKNHNYSIGENNISVFYDKSSPWKASIEKSASDNIFFIFGRFLTNCFEAVCLFSIIAFVTCTGLSYVFVKSALREKREEQNTYT